MDDSRASADHSRTYRCGFGALGCIYQRSGRTWARRHGPGVARAVV